MSLTLTVTLYRGQPPSQSMAISLDRQGGSIGRANTSNLVLPDPEKYVSTRHGTIDFRDNAYFLTDTSSNGIFLLPSDIALGRNNETPLKNGDRLGIGEYQILVEVTADEFLSPAPTAADIYKTPDRQDQDPFMDLGADPISELISSSENVTDEFDFFGSPPSSVPAKNIRTASDHVPVMDEAFEPIHGSQETPDPFTSPAQEGFLPENWFEQDDAKPAPDLEETLVGSFTPATEKPTIAPARKPTPALVEKPAVASSPDQESIRQFCEGAGIPEALFQQLSTKSFYSIGQMLKLSIQGAMDVLAARAEIKNEMRLDVTTLRAVENNPIKFSINADEALARLLKASEHEGYMEPVQALEEAFNDIKAHQMAVIAGMQTALQAVLKRFDPDRLEARLQKKNPISSAIPVHKQAKLWSQFEQLYEDIEQEAQDDFNRLFGREFSNAYEKQINLFKAQGHDDD